MQQAAEDPSSTAWPFTLACTTPWNKMTRSWPPSPHEGLSLDSAGSAEVWSLLIGLLDRTPMAKFFFESSRSGPTRHQHASDQHGISESLIPMLGLHSVPVSMLDSV